MSGSGCAVEEFEGIWGIEILEGEQSSRVVVAELASESVDVSNSIANELLVAAGQHLERFDLLGVGGHEEVVMPVGTNGIGEDLRVTRIALFA